MVASFLCSLFKRDAFSDYAVSISKQVAHAYKLSFDFVHPIVRLHLVNSLGFSDVDHYHKLVGRSGTLYVNAALFPHRPGFVINGSPIIPIERLSLRDLIKIHNQFNHHISVIHAYETPQCPDIFLPFIHEFVVKLFGLKTSVRPLSFDEWYVCVCYWHNRKPTEEDLRLYFRNVYTDRSGSYGKGGGEAFSVLEFFNSVYQHDLAQLGEGSGADQLKHYKSALCDSRIGWFGVEYLTTQPGMIEKRFPSCAAFERLILPMAYKEVKDPVDEADRLRRVIEQSVERVQSLLEGCPDAGFPENEHSFVGADLSMEALNRLEAIKAETARGSAPFRLGVHPNGEVRLSQSDLSDHIGITARQGEGGHYLWVQMLIWRMMHNDAPGLIFSSRISDQHVRLLSDVAQAMGDHFRVCTCTHYELESILSGIEYESWVDQGQILLIRDVAPMKTCEPDYSVLSCELFDQFQNELERVNRAGFVAFDDPGFMNLLNRAPLTDLAEGLVQVIHYATELPEPERVQGAFFDRRSLMAITPLCLIGNVAPDEVQILPAQANHPDIEPVNHSLKLGDFYMMNHNLDPQDQKRFSYVETELMDAVFQG